MSSALSFSDTSIAFESKTNEDLKRAHLLFKAIGMNWLVQAGAPLVNMAFAIKLPISGLIRKTVFKQFCGGESIEECEATTDLLAKYHIGTILDYSVEGKEEEAVFEATCSEILRTIEKAKGNSKIPFCVFKPTGIASMTLLTKISAKEQLNKEQHEELTATRNRMNRICKAAHDNDVRLFIDAEETWTQDAIDALVREMMLKYNKEKAIVFNTAQLYRHDRVEFIKRCYFDAQTNNYFLGFKLVRGAYMEKERERAKEMGYNSPIYPNKKATDKGYDDAVRFCVEHIDRIAICAGTHNESSSEMLVKLMEEKNIAKNDPRIYFSQLLGMSDHISFNLSHAGYNVVKYVPYGPVKNVLPYLIRRAQENTSVKGQTGRELSLILTEMKRRGMKK
ncbi:MAG: proline dehydrogenase family protein [Bacteroidia bacterium]|nr:proline dehydrogenase family protein [Bacteroidia bacterium]